MATMLIYITNIVGRSQRAIKTDFLLTSADFTSVCAPKERPPDVQRYIKPYIVLQTCTTLGSNCIPQTEAEGEVRLRAFSSSVTQSLLIQLSQWRSWSNTQHLQAAAR